jgi:hypothetical protein
VYKYSVQCIRTERVQCTTISYCTVPMYILYPISYIRIISPAVHDPVRNVITRVPIRGAAGVVGGELKKRRRACGSESNGGCATAASLLPTRCWLLLSASSIQGPTTSRAR